VGDVFNWSWGLWKERPWPVFAMFWAPVCINWAFAFGLTMLEESMVAALADRSTSLFITVVGRILAIVLQVWLGIGTSLCLFRIARRMPYSLDIIFSGGRSLLSVLISGTIVLVIAFLAPVFGVMAVSALLLPLRPTASAAILLLVVVSGGLGAV